jgi:hypothetical protein
MNFMAVLRTPSFMLVSRALRDSRKFWLLWGDRFNLARVFWFLFGAMPKRTRTNKTMYNKQLAINNKPK